MPPACVTQTASQIQNPRTLVDSPTTDQSQNGMVVDEQPSGGTQAAKGSTVTISIGRYSASG